jgi:hypothetical protein
VIQNLTADKTYGTTPLTTTFTVVPYDADSTHFTYGWGLDDFAAAPQFGSGSSASFTISQPGQHLIYCQVTDDTGLRCHAFMLVYVWPHDYDEREPNNTFAQAQDIGILPVAGFRGSLAGASDHGYDGSVQDYFKLGATVPSGKSVKVQLSYTDPAQAFTLLLLDNTGAVVAQTAAQGGSASLTRAVAGDQQPYRIELQADDSNGPNIEYTLAVSQQ